MILLYYRFFSLVKYYQGRMLSAPLKLDGPVKLPLGRSSARATLIGSVEPSSTVSVP